MSSVERYLSQLVKTEPQLETLKELYIGKKWHQLTEELLKLIHSGQVNRINLVELYDSFIREFESSLNPLALVRILVGIARKNYRDLNKALEFVDYATNSKAFISADEEASLFLKSETARLKLEGGNLSGVKQILEEVGVAMESTRDLDTVVHSSYHRVCAQYYKAVGPATKYYSSALLFFQYAPLDSFTVEERVHWAYDLGVASIVAETIFNFGEILEYDIMQSLKSEKLQWLLELLEAFKYGSIEKFNQIGNRARDQINQEPALSSNWQFLEQKIRLRSLMELATKKLVERVISFDDICSSCEVTKDQVEYLVMKALSLHLLQGTINEMDETVSISYVQPKTLDRNEVEGLYNRLIPWKTHVHEIALSLERSTEADLAQAQN
ncbi:26S proteasome regulatory subunit N9 [Galdieria sulphuraria]|uniref:26S proteasome regulatory subunit N9 n=1 Tax=Galdieria sulphuraria TaxID=130081 RepID=M2X6K6_GALSU|nr:26S proteasome regulatory subunit N9 [Galdieria sulphuraria]EME32150.1 26S proteasome regulatory subunit N9 [Galdieria sulphuraria]|eukprot:XP_005708670.1 26S proteasome regulatory subunit N9 [Galdieria sulphuraria]